MAYLLKLSKHEQISTRLAASAVEALVLIRTYAANGYSKIEAFDASDNREVSTAELDALVRQSAD